MKKTTFLAQFISILCFVGYFVIQVCVKPSELVLTVLAFLILLIIICVSQVKLPQFDWNFVSRETKVAVVGLILGLVIEVGLGLIARQQHWEGASLLGFPYWLPIMWAAGFVVIGRIYAYMVK